MLQQIKRLIPGALRDRLKKASVLARPTENIMFEKPYPSLSPSQLEFWNQNGFLALPSFFSDKEIDPVVDLIDRLWREREKNTDGTTVDIHIGSAAEKRILLRDAPSEARKAPYKLNDLFLQSELVRDLALHPSLAGVLWDLLEGDPAVCNSLSFERGSGQAYHFDTFYMPPPVQNKMCASWIALEDVLPEAGPLSYFPQSHQIPPHFFSHGRLSVITEELPKFQQYIDRQLKEFDLKSTEFLARKGDVFIWHAQLYHGGCQILDMEKTRKSLVTHYFRAKDLFRFQVKSLSYGRHYVNRGHQEVN